MRLQDRFSCVLDYDWRVTVDGDVDRVSCGQVDLRVDADDTFAVCWFGWRVFAITVDAPVCDGGHVVWSGCELFQSAFDHYRLADRV